MEFIDRVEELMFVSYLKNIEVKRERYEHGWSQRHHR